MLWCVVCVCGNRVGGGCGGVCYVHAWACVPCVGGVFGCLSSPFWAWFGGSVWVRGLCIVAPLLPRLWGPGVVPCHPWLGSVGGGASPCRLFACAPPSFSLPRRLGRCSPGALPRPFRLWWVGVGGTLRWLGSLPLVFPLGGADACTPRQGVTLLYGPSICTRSVQMDLLCSQVLQPFPRPELGTLWVAGESLRDRRVSCLPRWTVCPTRSPSLGPKRSTCRGECSWSGPLVTSPGRRHRGPLTNGPGRIPPYCVCSGGADTVTRGGRQTPEVGSLACVSGGPLSSRPPFRCVVCSGGFPVSPGWGGGSGGAALRLSWPCC